MRARPQARSPTRLALFTLRRRTHTRTLNKIEQLVAKARLFRARRRVARRAPTQRRRRDGPGAGQAATPTAAGRVGGEHGVWGLRLCGRPRERGGGTAASARPLEIDAPLFLQRSFTLAINRGAAEAAATRKRNSRKNGSSTSLRPSTQRVRCHQLPAKPARVRQAAAAASRCGRPRPLFFSVSL
jgi:hypothetical protein